MPISVIVGGQFGSEGKGKVTQYFANNLDNVSATIRCGGPNSGHSVIINNEKIVFCQLPSSCTIPNMLSIISAGSYINLDILKQELKYMNSKNALIIDPNAVILKPEYKNDEAYLSNIGSTKSGTGQGVLNRIKRDNNIIFAKDIDFLKPFIYDSKVIIRNLLNENKRIIIEGTQGFGLSVYSDFYPFVTSRDTTAAGFLSEVGLSPLDVDDIILVIRTYPIRVSGNSGPLKNEITWDILSEEVGYDIKEYTSVTKKIRRVARFDHELVKRAIMINKPTTIVLNHADYLTNIKQDIKIIEKQINHTIHYVGLNPYTLMPNFK